MNKNFLSHRTSTLLLLFIGALMLWLSWGKWMDTWVDFGDDLFIQWRIAHGAVLYKDIAYFRGPFPLYLNAAFFKIFGTSILTLVFTQLLMIVAVTVLTYLFFLETSGALAAFITSLVFLTMFAFPEYISMGNFNFVCPYTYAIVYGYVFALWGLYTLLRFIKRENTALAFLLGIITGIIFLIKVEIFIAFFLALIQGVMIWVQYLPKQKPRNYLSLFLTFVGGMIIPFGIFLSYFSQQMPWPQALYSLTLQYFPNPAVTNDIFYINIRGFDDPRYYVLQMFDWTVIYVFVIVLIAVFANISCRAKVKHSFNGLMIFFLGFFGFILWRNFNFISVLHMFMPLPLVVALFGAVVNRDFARTKTATLQMAGLSIFACFAFVFLIKILLKTSIVGYGFVLALPAVLLLVIIMVQFLPKLIDNLFNCGESLVCGHFLVLIGLVILFCVSQSSKAYSTKNFWVTNGSDAVISYDTKVSKYGLQFQKALSYVNSHLKPSETVLVLPEGALLNYLSRRDTGTHYFKIASAENAMWTEDIILQDFLQFPPDYIIYKSWREFGTGGYLGPKILYWIKTSYRRLKVIQAKEQADLIIVKKY